jgi:uncharacterized protein (TIGR03435 family)
VSFLSRTLSSIVLSAFIQIPSAVPPSATPAKPPLSWDSISIHVSDPADGSYYGRDHPDGITEHNVGLRELISAGYNFSVMPFRENEITGLPEWARTQRYDILARVNGDDVPAFKKLSNLSMKDTLAAFAARQPTGEMLMMQSLLQERFHLRVHWELKTESVFALTLAKGGLRMKPAADTEHGDMNFSQNHLKGDGVPLSFIASLLAIPVGHTVIDRTGITGAYDFDLHFAPPNTTADKPSNDPDIFTAVQEQLGLKLQSTHASIPILVVDHIEPPSPN